MMDFTFVIDYFHNGGKTLLKAIIILGLTHILASMITRFMKMRLHKSSLHLSVDPTQYNFLRHFVKAMIYMIGIGLTIYLVPSLKTLAVSLFAGAGILAIVIGFASQQAFSNIVSGILIVIFKPFRVGEKIKVGPDMMGTVEDITLRHTIIKNFQNKRLIIPNSAISNETIENWDTEDPTVCNWLEIGISYDADIDKAMKIMKQEAKKHPFFLDRRTDEQKAAKEEPVNVKVIGFGDSSVKLRAYVWAENAANAFNMGCDLNKSIKERFDKEGVEIPFPYRTIVYKKDITKPKMKKRR